MNEPRKFVWITRSKSAISPLSMVASGMMPAE
jgi:hypothetical protein